MPFGSARRTMMPVSSYCAPLDIHVRCERHTVSSLIPGLGSCRALVSIDVFLGVWTRPALREGCCLLFYYFYYFLHFCFNFPHSLFSLLSSISSPGRSSHASTNGSTQSSVFLYFNIFLCDPLSCASSIAREYLGARASVHSFIHIIAPT